MILTLLLIIPFLGALLLSLWPQGATPAQLRRLTLIILSVQCIASFAVLFWFDPSNPGLQLQERLPWLPSVGLDYFLAIDGISLPLVLMNAVLCLVAAVASRKIENRPRIYFALLLIISGAVNGAFLAQNLLLFFLFYELELIPLWLLIAIWGGANRAYASTKFLIVTAVSGVLILGAFLGIALVTGSVDFGIRPILSGEMGITSQLLLMGALLIGFGIKIPLFPFHTWLPDAHVEAPTGGSVILAAIMLKMGGYGFIRLSMPITPDASEYFSFMMIVLSLIAVTYIGFVALMQKDMKKLIAYSSISHMVKCPST